MWKQQGLLISVPEIVLIVWILTFALEKVREFTRIERSMTHAKMREFFFDQSTLFDLAAICGFFIGEILRFIPNQNCYLAARILLCINIILWYMKSMYSYKFLQSVGPKVYMIKKMVSQQNQWPCNRLWFNSILFIFFSNSLFNCSSFYLSLFCSCLRLECPHRHCFTITKLSTRICLRACSSLPTL